jgi:hypothetical protein
MNSSARSGALYVELTGQLRVPLITTNALNVGPAA